MKKFALPCLLAGLMSSAAFAQSSPNFTYGYAPTPQQWNSYFAAKQDLLGYTPANKSGDVFLGKVGFYASTASGGASINVPPGVTPTVPVNGDIWETSTGFWLQINNASINLFGGTSVVNAGTGGLESIMPVQTYAGPSKTFATADLYQEWRRSNSGSAMTDTFPAATATGLVNGTRVLVANVDATASNTITAGSGTTINGGSTDTVGPGREIAYVYDKPNLQWRRSLNTGTALLSANNLSDVASAATARTNLGLGSIATQSASAVAITGGTIDGTGIGATTASNGRFTTVTATGLVQTAASASGGAGFNLPPGVAPTSPNNGDCWTTAAGLYCRINGATVGPYGQVSPTQPTIQRFTSGSGTYTTPAGVSWIEGLIVGGGAGGGGGGTGAGSGAAGNPSCWNTSGAACTTPVYQAGGGAAGGGAAGAGSLGGTVSGSGTCVDSFGGGGSQGGGPSVNGSFGGTGGAGGSSSLGGAGASNAVGTGASNSGSGGGGGGSGNGVTSTAGAGGGAGATCRFIILNPAASYTYAVGGTAGGGTAGTGGAAGAAGAAGYIRIIEHYNP